MAKELTAKQENFCLAYVETGNASRAYRQAYDADNMKNQSVWNESSELLKSPHVSSRVKQLQQRYAELNQVTVESLTKELKEAQELARKTDNPTALINATMSKAKLHGLLVKKIETNSEIMMQMTAAKETVRLRIERIMRVKEKEGTKNVADARRRKE